MGAMAYQITSLMICHSTVYSGADQRKHQSSTSLAFVREIHRWLVNSLNECPVTCNMFMTPSREVGKPLVFFVISRFTFSKQKCIMNYLFGRHVQAKLDIVNIMSIDCLLMQKTRRGSLILIPSYQYRNSNYKVNTMTNLTSQLSLVPRDGINWN